MSDIDERLEEEIIHASRKSFDSQQAGINANFLMDVQREIERLRSDLATVTAERDRMRAALEPFKWPASAKYDAIHGKEPDDKIIGVMLKIGDMRRARAALGESDGNN